MDKGTGSFFTDKVVWTKIILLLIMILLFQFVIVSPVHATDEDSEWYGGKVFTPFMDLLVSLGDGLIGLCHSAIMGQPEALLRVDLQSKWWEKVISFIRVALAAVVGFVTFGVTGAIAIAIVAAIGPFGTGQMMDTFIADAIGKNKVKAAVYDKDFLPATLYLPLYNFSPEEIFEGKILLFNVDFFGKSKEIKVKTLDGDDLTKDELEEEKDNNEKSYDEKIAELQAEIKEKQDKFNANDKKISEINSEKGATNLPNQNGIRPDISKLVAEQDKLLKENKELEKKIKEKEKELKALQKEKDSSSNNFKVDYYYYVDETGNEIKTSKQDIGAELGKTISKWYVNIRDVAIVIMMIVLLYIAIRMLLSTVAGEKAKYKQMFQYWGTGMIILFTMHIIMIVAVNVTQGLTNMISAILDERFFESVIPNDSENKLKNFIEETDDKNLKSMLCDKDGNNVYDENGNLKDKTDDVYLVYKSNLLGYARIRLQLATWGPEYIGFFIAFFILVLLTVYFTFIYLRRVLYMAFLTLIAPVVAVTYPIDKINDGSAQGFDKWFKEYIFNLLLQPLHLLLYFVLIGSAFELSSTNIIYTLVAMGFMIPAEKLLRTFFGFEKASTPGVLGGVATGAITMGVIGKLAGGSKKALGKGNSSSGGSSTSSSSGGKESKIRFDKNDFDETSGALKNSKGNSFSDLNERRKEKKEQKAIINDSNSTDEQRENAEKEINRLRGEQRQALLNGKAARKLKSVHARGTQRLKNCAKSLPGNIIRYTGKGVGALGLGAIGAAAGITTGNMSNVGKYASTAALAGSSVGGRILEKPASSVDNIKALQQTVTPDEAYNRTYNSKQFEQLAKREYIENFKKDNKQRIIDELGTKDNYKEMVDSKVIENCYANGIEDINDIMSVYKTAKQDNSNKEFKEKVKDTIPVAKLEKKMGSDLNTPKEKDWKEYIMKKQNLNSDGANEMINRVKHFHDVKKS